MNTTDMEGCANEPFPVFQIPWAVFTGVAGGFNAFLLAAVANNWRILRQNVTHYYIVSCLLSSIVFCVLSVYDTVVSLYDVDATRAAVNGSRRYDPANQDHNTAMNLFAFRRGLIAAFFSVLQLNIVALIYGVSSNAFFVGRYGGDATKTNKSMLGISFFNKRDTKRMDSVEPRTDALLAKRLTAWLLIALSWLIPIAIAIPVPFGWSCVQYCKCLPVIRSVPDCRPSNDSHICFKHWPPVSSSYTIVVAGVWCLGMVMMFFSLASAILKFYRTHSVSRHMQSPFPRPNGDDFRSSQRKSDAGTHSESFGNGAQKVPGKEGYDQGNQPDIASITNIAAQADSLSSHNSRTGSLHTQELFRGSSTTSTPRRHKRPPLAPSVKMLIAISMSLFVTIFPVMLVMLVDATLDVVSRRMVFGVTLTVSLFYVASLPFLLLKYMSGLRQAVSNMIMKFPCLRKTVVVKSQYQTNQRRRNNAFEGDEGAKSVSAEAVDVVDTKLRDSHSSVKQ